MIVVSNASPIINLAAVERLDLLRQLYGQVTIPQAVYDEMVVAGAGQPGATKVATSGWIKTRQVTNETVVAALRLELDPGEAEAIALAVELKADSLLLDERKGREIALRLGCKTVGLLGILVEAKHTGLVPAVKPIMDELIERAGFWITASLYDRVLQAVEE
jgi:hypothetical protein